MGGNLLLSIILHSEKYLVPDVRVAKMGEAVTFICDAARSKTNLKWKFNGGSVLPETEILDNVLNILNVQPRHAGTYTCYQPRHLGDFQAIGTLKVLSKETIIIVAQYKVY